MSYPRLPYRPPPPPVKPKPKPRATAVAIRQEEGGEATVVAKGAGLVAERILELAWQAGVRVREDADLVQILNAIDLDSPIPADCFAAVAEILQYVYEANRALGGEKAP